MNEALVKAAKIGFASQYTFFLKAQFYHWNVEGIHFQELHALFERIYTEVYESIDDFAEKIRACGGYAPSSNTRFNMLSVIDDATEVTPPEAMVAELLQDAEHMVTIIKRVYDIAEAEGEHGFSNFLAERMDAFRKHAWMLRATAK
jgi:starvation-inducible DNA-binding protein